MLPTIRKKQCAVGGSVDMSSEASGASRTRKLLYDEYTGTFYFESKVESLKRACRQRQDKQDTLNKGEHLKLEYQCKQLDNARDIFLNKQSRQASALRHGLKDMVAYKRVLEEVAHNNEKVALDPLYGKYGLNITYFELTPHLDDVKIKMSPTYRRRKEAERLLQQRRRMEVMDRNATTPELMTSWRKRSLSASSTEELQPATSRLRRSAKLKLPAITADKSIFDRKNSCIQDPETEDATEGSLSGLEPTNAESEELKAVDDAKLEDENNAGVTTLPTVEESSAAAVASAAPPRTASPTKSTTRAETLPPIFVTENNRAATEVDLGRKS